MKEETLEEANELKYYFENDIIMLECINQMASTGHIPTRWSWFLAKISELYKQQERMYSQEEVAERLTNDFPVLEVRFNMTNEEIYGWFLEALQKGAKWQQEQFCNSEFLQRLRATKSDAEARRLINETFKNK